MFFFRRFALVIQKRIKGTQAGEKPHPLLTADRRRTVCLKLERYVVRLNQAKPLNRSEKQKVNLSGYRSSLLLPFAYIYKPIKIKNNMKTQKEFLQAIQDSPRWKKELKEAQERSDGVFYFTLGKAFNYFGLEKDFQSDTFIEKLMRIVNQ